MTQTPMQRALYRVIANDGIVTDPDSYCQTQAIRTSWEAAKRKGFIRPLTTSEVSRILENRRSVRTVVLAMLNNAANDESISPLYECGKPSVLNHCEALESVCSDIATLTDPDDQRFYTLTRSGLEYLEGENRCVQETFRDALKS